MQGRVEPLSDYAREVRVCPEHLRPVPAIGEASKSTGRVRRNGGQPLHGFYGASIFVVICDSGKNGQLRGDQESRPSRLVGPESSMSAFIVGCRRASWMELFTPQPRTARADLIVLYLRPRE